MDHKPAFRLCFRAEGKMVNAYLAHLDTMHDAILICSMRAALVEDREAADAYTSLVAALVAKMGSDLGHPVTRMERTDPPPNEGGHA